MVTDRYDIRIRLRTTFRQESACVGTFASASSVRVSRVCAQLDRARGRAERGCRCCCCETQRTAAGFPIFLPCLREKFPPKVLRSNFNFEQPDPGARTRPTSYYPNTHLRLLQNARQRRRIFGVLFRQPDLSTQHPPKSGSGGCSDSAVSAAACLCWRSCVHS